MNQILVSRGSVVDDLMYLRHADMILQGQWLGPYDVYTLLKSPFYSFWIAGTYFFHVPLFWSQQLFYIISCILLCFALYIRYRKIAVSVIVYSIVLFHPLLYLTSEYVLRYHIYTSMTIIIFSLLLILYDIVLRHKQIFFLYCGFLGFLVGIYYLTREEFIWILPCMLVTFLYGCFSSIRKNVLFILIKGMLIFLCTGLLVVGTYICINGMHYGVYTDTELRHSPYIVAYGDLLRIKSAYHQGATLIYDDMLDMAASVSPHFALIRPNFPEAKAYQSLFSFRYAADQHNVFTDAPTAFLFFTAIHKEISQACATGRLPCYPFNILYTVPFRFEDIFWVWTSVVRTVTDIITLRNINTYAYPSTADEQDYIFTKWIMRQRQATPRVDKDTPLEHVFSGKYTIVTPQTKWIDVLLPLYRCGMMPLGIIGISAFLITIFYAVFQKIVSFDFVYLTGVAGSICLYMIIVGYIDAIQFSIPSELYLSAVFPMFSIFCCLSIYAVYAHRKRR